eukprot:COSAG02_NODE_1576_length_11868_cov_82.967117_1_plen_1282_part_00
MGMLGALLTMTLLLLAACTPLASDTDAVSCFLRGGVASNVSSCDTVTAFSTFVLSKTSWTDHNGVNCYPDNGGHGASWGTGDLSSAQHQRYTIASCKAACHGNQHCNAITVGAAPQIPSLHLPPLVQRFRPPQQTPAQATAHAKLETKAKIDSEAARAWVTSYLGGSAVRKHLDASLQHYNGSQLLEMFEWEFQRLQLFHNAPIDGKRIFVQTGKRCCPDDTPLNETLNNGYLQQPCQRYVMGGGQRSLQFYQHLYTDRYGLDYGSCGFSENTTLQQANNCMLFNANNLLKKSVGNFGFGGITYVLNTKVLRGRLIFEPADGGLTESKYQHVLPGGRYPTLGTREAFLHLLQPHEELFNQSGNYKTIAVVLNRWWAPGTASWRNPGDDGSGWPQYFEVMADGNVWLPEDVLAMIAVHSNKSRYTWIERKNVWGTVLGKQLQDWNRQHKRPLIWVDGEDAVKSPFQDSTHAVMLLDPTVDGLAKVDRNGSKTSRFTDKDRQLFAQGWANGKGFGWLANGSSPHLHLTWPSWQKKHVCHAQDASMTQFVLGVDGNNECVYWEAAAFLPASAPTGVASVAKASAGARWECLNDGACVPSNSSRAVFPTKQACLSGGCGTSFTCIKDIPSSAAVKAAYCLPLVPMQPGGASRLGVGNYTSLDSCSKACYPFWDWMTEAEAERAECLNPPSGGMPSAYAVCGTPWGVGGVNTGIYIKTQHTCSGQPVYQQGGANGPVLYRCNCPGSYDAGWCVSKSSRINDCSVARCPDHSDRFLDNAACQCVRPDAQQCTGQWQGLYDGEYRQPAHFVTVVPVDPTRASEPYFLPGGNCQLGNDAPVFQNGIFERLFAKPEFERLLVSPWWLASFLVALAVAAAATMRATVLTCRQSGETYQALDDETPAQIAVKLMLDLDVLMQLNTPRYAALRETSRLRLGTVLLLPDAYSAVSASPTPPEGLLCAGCGMGRPGVKQQSLQGPSQSVELRVVDHQLESPLLHCGGGDDDNSSGNTGSRGLLPPGALVGGDGDGAGYVELPGGSIINLQGEVSSHGASSPLGTEQTEQKKRVVNSTKSRKEYRQELQRRRARLRNLYCLVAGVGLAIASLVCYLTVALLPPMTAIVKVTNPDAKLGCKGPTFGCELTATYVRLNVSKTCHGAPIYQDKRGNVLYRCFEGATSFDLKCKYRKVPLKHEIRGWCTGPAARIEDCSGGCGLGGHSHYLENFGSKCASAMRPDLCFDHTGPQSWFNDYREGIWSDCGRNPMSSGCDCPKGQQCPNARGVIIEFVQNAQ